MPTNNPALPATEKLFGAKSPAARLIFCVLFIQLTTTLLFCFFPWRHGIDTKRSKEKSLGSMDTIHSDDKVKTNLRAIIDKLSTFWQDKCSAWVLICSPVIQRKKQNSCQIKTLRSDRSYVVEWSWKKMRPWFPFYAWLSNWNFAFNASLDASDMRERESENRKKWMNEMKYRNENILRSDAVRILCVLEPYLWNMSQFWFRKDVFWSIL